MIVMTIGGKVNEGSQQASCPVCGNERGLARLWQASSEEAAQHFVLKEKNQERHQALKAQIEILWRKDTCDIVQCDECGFCFSHPYVSGDAKFYDLAFHGSGYPSWKWEFQLTYDELKNNPAPTDPLLEIGAGNGAFVSRIADNVMPRDRILCTEFSVTGAEAIQKLGVKCLQKDVRQLNDEEFRGAFQTVCMFQVLEHMDDLHILFSKLNWLLKDGGSLFIAVPNEKRIAFNEAHGALMDMPPNHVGRWTQPAFDKILRKYGFTLRQHRVEPISLVASARGFALYRYLRSSQRRNSIANVVERINSRPLRAAMRIAGLGVHVLAAAPVFFKMSRDCGYSQWVHAVKTGTSTNVG